MLNLVMLLHCHQPVGNFDKVFRIGVDQCYRPILDLLEEHPWVRLGLHYSGPLLEWLEEHDRGLVDQLARLVARGQVEPVSGGFYEPLLATIPGRDARGQVALMNDYLAERTGVRPTGFWLTERVWEPSLPRTLEGSGLEYTVVDDTHFYYAGLEAHQVYQPYLTEKLGSTLTLLATPMRLRYIIPFKPVPEVMGELHDMEQRGIKLAVYGDDGEKFGMWPGTHEWVIQKGWLRDFFRAIGESGDWLATRRPADYLAENPPAGRIYMPQASYEEMTEWTLLPDGAEALEDMTAEIKNQGRWEAWRPFVRGGVWDNFLVKYPESNRMQKKAVHLSGLLPDDPEARRDLWRAQCNCAYWHGVFGGLYLGHLRRAVHECLIKAQRSLASAREGMALEQCDLYKNGGREVMVGGRKIAVVIEPERGGGIADLSLLDQGLNLMDILTRRREAYHRRIRRELERQGGQGEQVQTIHEMVKFKEQGLERFLIYDEHTRSCCLDRFLPPQTGPDDFAAGRYQDLGDFVSGAYTVESAEPGPESALVRLNRGGRVGGARVLLVKSIEVLDRPALRLEYRLVNEGGEPVEALFGCELNLTLYSDEDRDRYLYVPQYDRRREVYEIGREDNFSRLEMVNRGDGLNLVILPDQPATAFFFPIMTVSLSEEGFEKTYQGTSLLLARRISLPPGEQAAFGFEMVFEG